MEEVKNILNELIIHFPVNLAYLVIDYIPAANVLAINGKSVKFIYIRDEILLLENLLSKSQVIHKNDYACLLQSCLFYQDFSTFDKVYDKYLNLDKSLVPCNCNICINYDIEWDFSFYLRHDINQSILRKLYKLNYMNNWQRIIKKKIDFHYKYFILSIKENSQSFSNFQNSQSDYYKDWPFNVENKIDEKYEFKPLICSIENDWYLILKLQKYLIKTGEKLKIDNFYIKYKLIKLNLIVYNEVSATEFPYFIRNLYIIEYSYWQNELLMNRILEICRFWLLESFNWL